MLILHITLGISNTANVLRFLYIINKLILLILLFNCLNVLDFNDIEEKYVLLQKEESNLRKEKDNLQKENKILLQNEQQNLKEIETLGSLYKTLSKDYESLKIEHCNIRTENERLHNENKEASSEINILSKRLECSDIKCNEQQLLIMKLKEELYKSNEERRSLHNNIQDLKGNDINNIGNETITDLTYVHVLILQ